MTGDRQVGWRWWGEHSWTWEKMRLRNWYNNLLLQGQQCLVHSSTWQSRLTSCNRKVAWFKPKVKFQCESTELSSRLYRKSWWNSVFGDREEFCPKWSQSNPIVKRAPWQLAGPGAHFRLFKLEHRHQSTCKRWHCLNSTLLSAFLFSSRPLLLGLQNFSQSNLGTYNKATETVSKRTMWKITIFKDSCWLYLKCLCWEGREDGWGGPWNTGPSSMESWSMNESQGWFWAGLLTH